MTLTVFALLLVAAATVKGLDPYQLYAEGSCSKIQAQPARNLNRQALEGMSYINGGSRYQMLRIASPHPQYDSITENELISGFCLRRNTTLLRDNSITSAIGFGRVLSSFDVHLRDDDSGILFEAVPRDSAYPSWETLVQMITLTDNRNFAVALNCWTGSDQAGWHVISRSPNLDERTRRIVAEHVRQLGFDEENMIILRNNRCQNQGLGLGRGGQSGSRQQSQQRGGQRDRQSGSQERQRSSQRLSSQGQGQRQQGSLRQGQRQQGSLRQGQGQQNSLRQSSRGQGRDYLEDIEGLGPRRELVRPDIFENDGSSNLKRPSLNEFRERDSRGLGGLQRGRQDSRSQRPLDLGKLDAGSELGLLGRQREIVDLGKLDAGPRDLFAGQGRAGRENQRSQGQRGSDAQDKGSSEGHGWGKP